MQDDDVSLDRDTIRTPPPPRVLFRSYGYVVEQSRRIGRAAVRTLGGVRAILERDVVGLGHPKVAPAEPKQKFEEIQAIASQAHEVLASIHGVFPFTLFPDSIVLDRTKVTLTRRFLFSEDIISVRVEDVLNVAVHTGILFATLSVAIRVMNSTDHYQVKTLWIRDALQMKRLIQGYVIAQHNNINITHLGKDEMLSTLDELGKE